MSFEIMLARFGPSGEEVPKHRMVLRELECIARDLTGKAGEEDAVFPRADGASFDIDLSGGTATVGPAVAQFPIQELDPLTLRVVFEIARAGDMAIITEGGDYSAVLTDPAQRPRLPEVWRDGSATPVCTSPEHLERLLQGWYQWQTGYAAHAFSDTKMGRPSPASVTGCNLPTPVDLYRFDRSGNEVPRHPDVLRDLLRVAESHLESLGPKARLVRGNARFGKASATWAFEMYFPLGEAEVFASHARIRVYDLDLPATRLLFEIARAGDMSFIGGRVSSEWAVIFTDNSQVARAPEGWIKARESPIVCQSADEIMPSLRRILGLDIPPDKRVRVCGESTTVPGSGPDFLASFVYVEAKPKETATKQVAKVPKFFRQVYKAGGPHQPELGMMTPEWWRLETPAGQVFYVYGFGGDKKNYLALFRDFAAAEGRAVGRIVNFDTFVLDDGHTFPLSACQCTKVRE